MLDVAQYACTNKDCQDYSIKNKGNLALQFQYGPKKRWMLRCSTCKSRFSETKGTPLENAKLSATIIGQILRTTAEGNGVRATGRLVGVSKNATNRIILKVGSHCSKVLQDLLHDLELTEVQLDELWSFIEKKVKPGLLRQARRTVEPCGSGPA